MKKILLILLVSVFISPASIYAGTLNYVGSSTVGKFLWDAKQVYKGSTFDINTKSESSGGEKCVVMGTCDMGGVARNVNKEFLDSGVVTTLIGKDAIAVIVNEENPVKSLTSAQLKAIFSGRIRNWSEVGGPNLTIEPFIVKEYSAIRKVFKKVILGGEEYKECKVITPDSRIVYMVSNNKGGIGQISFAFLKHRKSIRPLRVDGQKPSVNNLRYPITRPLFIVTKGNPTGEVKAFLEWTLSQKGQEVLKKRFIGVK